MIIYYIVFLIVFLLSLFFQLKTTDYIKIAVILFISLLLVCLAGLRGNDPDYLNYLDIFSYSYLDYKDNAHVEVGFYHLNKWIYLFGLPFQFVIFLMAMLAISYKIIFFTQYSLNPVFSILIYYTSIFIIYDFIAIRQGLVLSIFMFSIVYIIDKKPYKYVLTLATASLMHISAVILIPLYFFINKVYKKYFLYGILIICLVINILAIRVPLAEFLLSIVPLPESSQSKAIFYLENTDQYSNISIRQLSIAFISVLMKDKVKLKHNLENILVNLLVFGIFLGTLLNEISEFSFRLKWYFLWPEYILVASYIYYLSKNRIGLAYGLYSLFAIMYFNSLYTFLHALLTRDDSISYKFFFQ